MNNKIKLIAFDLDGTLLNSEKQITGYTREVLKRAIAEGIEVVPSTGRPIMGVPEEFCHFPGIRYAVTSNGARLIEIATKRTLYESLLSYEKAKEVLAVLTEYDVMLELFYDGQGYIDEAQLPDARRYIQTKAMTEYITKTRVPVKDLEGMFERERRAVDKVQGLFANQQEKQEAFDRLRLVDGIEPSGALHNNIETNAGGVHKGIALTVLGKRLGIKPEEMMAFGDGSNDIKMMRTVGIGVAVANAQDTVRESADDIADSNDEDGVARYIEKHVLS